MPDGNYVIPFAHLNHSAMVVTPWKLQKMDKQTGGLSDFNTKKEVM